MLNRAGASSISLFSLHSPWSLSKAVCFSLVRQLTLDQRLLAPDRCRWFSSEGEYSSTAARVDFRQSRRWEELREVLMSLKSDIRTIEISEALNALKRLKVAVPVGFLCEMRDLVLARVDQLHTREAGDILHACAKLGFFDSDLFVAIAKTVADGQCKICRFDNRGLVTMVYSLGQFKKFRSDEPGGEKTDMSVLYAAVKQATEEIRAPYRTESMSGWLVVNMLYALGLLQYRENKSSIGYLLDLAFQEETMAHMNEQQFSMLISALHELQVPCTAEHWQCIEKELLKKERRETMSGKGLANVMRRLGLMGFPHKDTFECLAQECVKPHRLQEYNGQDIANLVHTIAVRGLNPEQHLPCFEGRVVDPRVLSSFKEQELCNVLYGCALSKPEGKDDFFRTLGREAIRKPRLSRYTPQGISMIVYSFGLVKCHDYETLECIGAECMKTQRLKSFTEQSLSSVIYGLGRLRVDVVSLRRFAEVLLTEATTPERLDEFKGQAFANIIYSLAQLRMPQYLAPLLDKVCEPRMLPLVNDQGLSNILQSLSWLSYSNSAKIKILMTEAVKRGQTGTLSELATSNILTAATGMQDRAVAMPFLRTAGNKEKLQSQTSSAIVSILERYAKFELRDYKLVNPVLTALSHRDRIGTLKNEELVSVLGLLWKLGMASHRVLPCFVDELSSAARWKTLTPSAMAEALVFLGWLQYPDQQIFAEMCRILTEAKNLRQIEIDTVIAVLQSLKPSFVSLEHVESFVEYLSQKGTLKQLEGRHLPDVLQFHVSFGLRDGERINCCLQEMTQSQRLGNLTLKDVGIALECVIALGLQDADEVPKLVSTLARPAIFEHCRVHYVAKVIICLCRLGKQYKSKAMKLVEKLVEPPWSTQVVEKDLMDVLKTIKDVGYEYGKVGRLLNRNRQQTKFSLFLTAEDTRKANKL